MAQPSTILAKKCLLARPSGKERYFIRVVYEPATGEITIARDRYSDDDAAVLYPKLADHIRRHGGNPDKRTLLCTPD
jgi:hypothetical protein